MCILHYATCTVLHQNPIYFNALVLSLILALLKFTCSDRQCNAIQIDTANIAIFIVVVAILLEYNVDKKKSYLCVNRTQIALKVECDHIDKYVSATYIHIYKVCIYTIIYIHLYCCFSYIFVYINGFLAVFSLSTHNRSNSFFLHYILCIYIHTQIVICIVSFMYRCTARLFLRATKIVCCQNRIYNY